MSVLSIDRHASLRREIAAAERAAAAELAKRQKTASDLAAAVAARAIAALRSKTSNPSRP
jgi:hypothetical protein